MPNYGRQITYSAEQSDQHYRDAIGKEACLVCLAGMASTHGLGNDPETRARLGENWWKMPTEQQSRSEQTDALTRQTAADPFSDSRYPEFQERADSLINDLADAIDHEPCAYTLKASSGLILDHLLTLIETAARPDAFSIWTAEIERCTTGFDSAGDGRIFHGGQVSAEKSEAIDWMPADTQSFYSVSVIVQDALDEQDVSSELLDSYLETIEQEAKQDGLETAVYAVFHDHPLDTDENGGDGREEDVCIQYSTDHRPIRTWNSAE